MLFGEGDVITVPGMWMKSQLLEENPPPCPRIFAYIEGDTTSRGQVPTAVWDVAVLKEEEGLLPGFDHNKDYLLTILSPSPIVWELREKQTNKSYCSIP